MASISNLNDLSGGSQEGVSETEQVCVVCGDGGAKTHYGVLACLGCKGFFRRALKKANQYECFKDNLCRINKYERNTCRSCRLRKCLDVGMDPNFVRPDRDFTGKQQGVRLPAQQKYKINRSLAVKTNKMEQEKDNYSLQSRSKGGHIQSIAKTALLPLAHDGWIRKLPLEMRTILMSLLNIEAKVTRGDTCLDASEIYPLHISTIREIIDEPVKLHGKRTEMRYEAHRLAKNQELSMIVYRRLIAAVDWVELLSELMPERLSTDDRIALVKSCFAPLMLFKCSAKTAVVTEKENLLCLCNFAYVPRNIAKAYSDTYHLDNGLVDRLLNELVSPFRRIHLTDGEIVCLSAIIVLNPMTKDLSEQGVQKVNQLRDKIYDTLYIIIKESRPYSVPSSEFGNLLLYLPIVTGCANAMSENLRFAQTFSSLGGIPLLTSLFGCFPVEPFLDGEIMQIGLMLDEAADQGKEMCFESTQIKKTNQSKPVEVLRKDAGTQTQDTTNAERGKKRRLPPHFTSPVENESMRDFRLFRTPCSYTLEEMFDDLNDDSNLKLKSGSQQPNHLRRPGPTFHQKNTSYFAPQCSLLNNWTPPSNFNRPVVQATFQEHQTLRAVRSLHGIQFPSIYNQEFEAEQNMEPFGFSTREYYPNQWNSYYLEDSQRNDTTMYGNMQQQQQPSLGIQPISPIEKLTFKHHN